MVLRQPLAGHRAGIHIDEAGTPLFIAEIASASTVRGDREGKRIAYARVGIPEYLIFDPDGEILGRPVEAWRLPTPSATVYEPWRPTTDGLWQSASLEVSFGPGRPLPVVRDRDGTLIEPPSPGATAPAPDTRRVGRGPRRTAGRARGAADA